MYAIGTVYRQPSRSKLAVQRKLPRPKPQAKSVRIPFLGREIISFVDGVSGAGGIVELTVAEIALPQCANGMDDDGDGKTDYPEDPGCLLPDDRDENRY